MFYIVITNWLHHLHPIQSSTKVDQLSFQANYNYEKKFSYMKRHKRRISMWKQIVSFRMFSHVYRRWMHFIRTTLANRDDTRCLATSDPNWNKQHFSNSVKFSVQRKSFFVGHGGRSPPEGELSGTAGWNSQLQHSGVWRCFILADWLQETSVIGRILMAFPPAFEHFWNSFTQNRISMQSHFLAKSGTR